MGTVQHLARPAEAVNFVAFALGRAGGRLPVYVDGSDAVACWLPCEPGLGEELWRRAHRWDLERSWQVEVGAPRSRDGVLMSAVLWVWATSPESLARAARFRPAPAFVLRFGGSSERLCVWPLEEPVDWGRAQLLNERIAYAIHAPRTRAAPAALRIPLPGTFLRVGRSRPAPVLVTRMDLDVFAPGQVAGRLKDPPPPDAWKQRAS